MDVNVHCAYTNIQFINYTKAYNMCLCLTQVKFDNGLFQGFLATHYASFHSRTKSLLEFQRTKVPLTSLTYQKARQATDFFLCADEHFYVGIKINTRVLVAHTKMQYCSYSPVQL